MKNIPEKIFLQHGLTDEELKDVDYEEIHEWMTFSAYQLNKDDLEYVHISQLKEAEDYTKDEEIHDLKSLISTLESQLENNSIIIINSRSQNHSLEFENKLLKSKLKEERDENKELKECLDNEEKQGESDNEILSDMILENEKLFNENKCLIEERDICIQDKMILKDVIKNLTQNQSKDE